MESKYGAEAARYFFNAANDHTVDGFFQKLGVFAVKLVVLLYSVID